MYTSRYFFYEQRVQEKKDPITVFVKICDTLKFESEDNNTLSINILYISVKNMHFVRFFEFVLKCIQKNEHVINIGNFETIILKLLNTKRVRLLKYLFFN